MKRNKIVLGIVLGLILMATAYGLLNVLSATNPVMFAVIETEIPMLTTSNVGMSLNGGLTITAPNIPGHWESKHGYFTNSREVKFCPIETIGIQKFTFVPDNRDLHHLRINNVYSIVFVWRAHITEIILALVIIVLFVSVYMNTKTSSAPQKENFTTT